MAKVLTIELGHSVIKLCEMDYKVKKPKIYQCQEAITPLGAVNDGYIADNKMKDLAYAIKETIARNGIKTKKVIFTVASAKIINREVTVPAVKESQISSVIQANLNDYFPVSLADYEVTQSLVQTIAGGADSGKHRVLVFAAEKTLIDSYRRLAHACGLDMLNVCCSGASIIESARGQATAGCQAIIKMEEKYSIISVMKDGVLLLQRSINYGVGDAMNEVATQPTFAAGDTLGVWRLITRQNCTSEQVPNVKEAGRPEARAAVSEALTPLLNGIVRVFDYFNSHFDGNEIDNVSIIGLGAQFIGVPEVLGETLGIVCRKAGMFRELEMHDSDVLEKSDAYFSCIGAGFAVDGFVHDDGKGKLSKEPNYVLLSVLVAVLAFVVSIVLVVTSVLPFLEASAKKIDLEAKKITYQAGKDAYDKYVATNTLHNEIVYGTNMSQKPNDNLLLFFDELEKKMPADTLLDQLASDDKQCVMVMYVPNKSIAAKSINTLRTFESIQTVTVQTLEDVEPEEENYFFDDNFDNGVDEDEEDVLASKQTYTKIVVNCVYYPVVDEVDTILNQKKNKKK